MSLGDELKRAAEGGEFDPPDGLYRVKVVDTYAGIARSGAQNPFAKAVLQIVGGELAGRRFSHFMSLSEGAMQFSAEALLLYGVWLDGIEDVDDLSLAMDKVVGTVADVTVKHRQGFMNVNVNRVLTGESDVPAPDDQVKPKASFADMAAVDSPDGDDEIPY
jgi:hypothetical protein